VEKRVLCFVEKRRRARGEREDEAKIMAKAGMVKERVTRRGRT